jgi:hypothetical protein
MEVENVRVDISEQEVDSVVMLGLACIVGKLLADRVVGKEILKTPLIRAWRPTGWVTDKRQMLHIQALNSHMLIH